MSQYSSNSFNSPLIALKSLLRVFNYLEMLKQPTIKTSQARLQLISLFWDSFNLEKWFIYLFISIYKYTPTRELKSW